MKHTSRLLQPTFVLTLLAGTASAGGSLLDDAVLVLSFPDASGGTQITAENDGTFIYTAQGGSQFVNMARYFQDGTLDQLFQPGPDFRSLYLDNNGQLYAKEFGQGSVYSITQGGVATLLFTLFDPESQSSASLNGDDSELYTMSGGEIRRYDATNGNFLGSFALTGWGTVGNETGFPDDYQMETNGSGRILTYTLGIVSEWDLAGNRIGTCNVPIATAGGFDTTWSFSVASDNFVYLYNEENGRWEVYDVGIEGNEPQCFALDFETDDTGAAMAHGTRVDAEFDGGVSYPVTITGVTNDSGDNTVAILNSSTGPAAQDRDLLVGSGNILILQTDSNLSECPPGSGVYCSHNDDEDGGRINFEFNASVTASSIDLIDVDATDQNWRVVLVDSSGDQRIYVAQTNWTGDLVTDGPPGMGTLDLTTLADQPGFGSDALATEDPGFDADDVLRIFVEIEGSGGVDNLNWCSTPGVLAAVKIRNGSGQNPMNLTSVSLPVIGETWSADLDCRAYGSGMALLLVRAVPLPGPPSSFGEILVGGQLFHRTSRHYSGSVSRFTWNIPDDLSLYGLEVHAQGLCTSSSGAVGPKTYQILGGLSNALDLTLGF